MDVNQSSIEGSYYYYLNKGAKGLTRAQLRSALFDLGQNPTSIDIDHFWSLKQKTDLYHFPKELKHLTENKQVDLYVPEDDVVTLAEMEELNKTLGDPKEKLKRALVHFDKDKNGKIDRYEMREILRLADQLDNSVKENDAYVDHILKLGDRNGDNMIEIDDLVTMIQDGLLWK